MQDEAVAGGTNQHELLPTAGVVPAHCDIAGLDHGLAQQAVGFVATLVWPEQARLLEVDGVDLLDRDELLDLDRAVTLLLERLELVLTHHDVLVARVLVAPHGLRARDRLIALATGVTLLEPAAVLLMQHAEAHGLGAGGGVDLDRNRHEAERDRARRDRASCHGGRPCLGGGAERRDVCPWGTAEPIIDWDHDARPQALSREARLRAHSGAVWRRSGAARPARSGRADLRRPAACCPLDALGPAARDRRRARQLGGSSRPLTRSAGQAPGAAHRRSPHRVRHLRGRDSRGELRSGCHDRVGPRRLPHRGRRLAARITREGQARPRLQRSQAARPLRTGADQAGGRQALAAAVQGSGGRRSRSGRGAAGLGLLRTARRRATRGCVERPGDRGAGRGAGRTAAPDRRGEDQAHARRDRRVAHLA